MGSNIKLSELSDFITCPLCRGYLIDATTINECLHTFCKSCIVKYIKNDNNECPKCKTLIHERRPLDYIVYDRSKQDIVYKLVPQLYVTELDQRFSSQKRSDTGDSGRPVKRRAKKQKSLDVVLVLRNSNSTDVPQSQQKDTPVRSAIYLKCPITINTGVLRKLLVLKYQLGVDCKVSLFYKGDMLDDSDQISNLAQSLTFCLQYEILRVTSMIMKKEEDTAEIPIQNSCDP